jgi:hypothetical protein
MIVQILFDFEVISGKVLNHPHPPANEWRGSLGNPLQWGENPVMQEVIHFGRFLKINSRFSYGLTLLPANLWDVFMKISQSLKIS